MNYEQARFPQCDEQGKYLSLIHIFVYCNKIREAYGNIPIIIGGIEASLRRFPHYDYWSDKVRRSILIDSGADLLIFGMGERQVVEVADLLSAGVPVREIKGIMGTMYIELSLIHI